MSDKEKKEQGVQVQAAAKKKSESKPGFFSRIGRWLREMRSELKKVQWPTAKQTVNNTLIVIACVVAVGIFIWAFDFVATNVIQALISLFK